MIKFHLYIALLCFNELKTSILSGIGACCYNRSLIFVLCFAISFSGCIPSSFPWFCKHEITISMFAGDYYSVHHCILDCHPVLSLTAFASS
jgi:hypothetical protein